MSGPQSESLAQATGVRSGSARSGGAARSGSSRSSGTERSSGAKSKLAAASSAGEGSAPPPQPAIAMIVEHSEPSANRSIANRDIRSSTTSGECRRPCRRFQARPPLRRVARGLTPLRPAYLPLRSKTCVRHRTAREDCMLLLLVIILLVLALGGGGWSYPRYGYWGWSPAGVLLVILLVLLLARWF